VIATQIDISSMSSLLFRFSIGVILMSLGLFILRYRYPCITIHGLEDSISCVRVALQRCHEERVSATVWGRYEADLWKYVHIMFLVSMRYSLRHHLRVEDMVSLLKEKSSRRMFRWPTMHTYIWHHLKTIPEIIRCYDDIQVILASIDVSTSIS
jgi:hypothetical protein